MGNMYTDPNVSKPKIIKVKLWGRYRRCELRKVHDNGSVDVRVMQDEVVSDMPSFFQRVVITNVRKADRHLCVK